MPGRLISVVVRMKFNRLILSRSFLTPPFSRTTRGRLLVCRKHGHVITYDRPCSLSAPWAGFIWITASIFRVPSASVYAVFKSPCQLFCLGSVWATERQGRHSAPRRSLLIMCVRRKSNFVRHCCAECVVLTVLRSGHPCSRCISSDNCCT